VHNFLAALLAGRGARLRASPRPSSFGPALSLRRFLAAGKRRGLDGETPISGPNGSGLFHQCKPRTILGEQVEPAAFGFGWLDLVCTQLENIATPRAVSFPGCGCPEHRTKGKRLYWGANASWGTPTTGTTSKPRSAPKGQENWRPWQPGEADSMGTPTTSDHFGACRSRRERAATQVEETRRRRCPGDTQRRDEVHGLSVGRWVSPRAPSPPGSSTCRSRRFRLRAASPEMIARGRRSPWSQPRLVAKPPVLLPLGGRPWL